MPDGILIATTSGEIAFVNEQLTTLFGGSAAELLGCQVDDLLPEELKGAHRAHRNRYRAHPEVRSMGADRTLRARRLDGSEFDTEISLSPLRLGDQLFVLAAVRDVSDRIEAEDHFRRVLETLDTSDDGVFMFDAGTLRYTYVNEGAVRLVGYERDDLFEMTPLDLNPHASEGEYRELVERLLTDLDHHVHRESSLLRKDGTEIPVDKIFRAAPTAATAPDGSSRRRGTSPTASSPRHGSASRTGRSARPSRPSSSPRTGIASPATSMTPSSSDCSVPAWACNR